MKRIMKHYSVGIIITVLFVYFKDTFHYFHVILYWKRTEEQVSKISWDIRPWEKTSKLFSFYFYFNSLLKNCFDTHSNEGCLLDCVIKSVANGLMEVVTS